MKGESVSSELTTLVSIENSRFLGSQRLLQSGQTKRTIHRHQVHKAIAHRDIGDVATANLIRMGHFEIRQQIGINLMILRALCKPIKRIRR